MRFQKTLLAVFVALFMASLAGCASTEKHSSAAEYIDDAVITTKVKAALFGDPDLSAAEINVETYNGEVQLSGFVSTKAQIAEAVKTAERSRAFRKLKTAAIGNKNASQNWPFLFTLHSLKFDERIRNRGIDFFSRFLNELIPWQFRIKRFTVEIGMHY